MQHAHKPKTDVTDEEAVEVWLRYWHGEAQHHIAADYGVNPGRISAVVKERKHLGSREIAESRRNRAA